MEQDREGVGWLGGLGRWGWGGGGVGVGVVGLNDAK